MTTTEKTHARIVNGGTPELITWREFCDEVESAKAGVRSRKVKTVSSDNGGKTFRVTYAPDYIVTLRPATDADQPAAAPVETEQPAPVADPKLTPLMVRCLVQGRNNRDGHYATNIRNGGGTSGALLRRGLIEHLPNGPRGSAYYYTAAGLELAHRLAAEQPKTPTRRVVMSDEQFFQ